MLSSLLRKLKKRLFFSKKDQIKHRSQRSGIIDPMIVACIAAHVYPGKYKDGILIGGWEPCTKTYGVTLIDESKSFYSALYMHKNGGKTRFIYAFPGTRSAKDILEDGAQLTGMSEHYEIAKNNAKKLKEKFGKQLICFVGHSKGGGEAALCALATNGNAVTFNPAGLSYPTQVYNGTSSNNAHIEAFITEDDIVNNIQDTILVRKYVGYDGIKMGIKARKRKQNKEHKGPLDSLKKILEGHYMTNFLDYYGIDYKRYKIKKDLKENKC